MNIVRQWPLENAAISLVKRQKPIEITIKINKAQIDCKLVDFAVGFNFKMNNLIEIYVFRPRRTRELCVLFPKTIRSI